jgi:hypothetical protein
LRYKIIQYIEKYSGLSPSKNKTNMKKIIAVSAILFTSLHSDGQNIGIGTNSPTEQLHTTEGVRFQGLTQDDNSSQIISKDANGKLFWKTVISLNKNFWSLTGNSLTNPGAGFGQNYLGTSDATRIVFATNSQEKMTILAGGQVGIGIANPGAKLQIESTTPDTHLWMTGSAPSLVYTSSVSNGTYARVAYATGINDFSHGAIPGDLIVQTSSNVNSCIFSTGNALFGSMVNGIERARINQRGQFGISTMSPTAALHINCSVVPLVGPSNIRFANLQSGTGNNLVIDNDGYVTRSSVSGNGGWSLSGNSNTNPGTGFGQNYFGTTDQSRVVFGANASEKMTILPGGEIGIGISSPTSKLHVESTIPDTHLRMTGTSPSMVLTSSVPNDTYARIAFATGINDFSHGAIPGDLIVQTSTSTNSCIFATGNALFGSMVNGIERARINQNGQFGISTMNPTAALHVNCSIAPLVGASNIRFENLQQGGGNYLVIDANGYVRQSVSSIAGREQQQEIENLKNELLELKAQLKIISEALKLNTSPK